MEEQFQTVKRDMQGMGLKDYFFKYVRFLPLIIISVALALVGAFLYLRYATPVYRSNGALIVKKDNPGTNSADPFQQLFVMDNSMNIQNEIEILQSQPVLERVVDSLDLNFSYFSIGKIAETNLYTGSPFTIEALQLADSNSSFTLNISVSNKQSFRINNEENIISFGQTFKSGFGLFRLVKNPDYNNLAAEYRVIWQPTRSVAGLLGGGLSVAPKGATGTVLISLEANHPQLAADVINQLMKEYQVVTREDKNETNRRMLDFIDRRMKGVEKELDSVTGKLLAFQNKNDIIVPPEAYGASYFQQIEENEREIISGTAQDNIAQQIENYLGANRNAYETVPSSLGLSDATLNGMIGEYNQAQTERKHLIDANIPVTNPRVQQQSDRIERLRVNILESLRILRRSISITVNRLEKTGTRFNTRFRTLPAKEQNLQEIKRQQASKQAVFNLLMEKREQTAISLAGTISNMKVIGPAHPNLTPVKPNRKATRIIAVVIGLALPVLLIFLLESLNDKVNSRHDVEKATDVPIIGEIGHSFIKDTLIVKPNNRGVVAEQFRIIRSNLQFFLTKIEKPVLLVTSSFSGEGKSLISTNLGAVMSLASKKTIVIELDIRKPKILSQLNITKNAGIISYLLGKIRAEELPIAVPGYDNLYVMACGPVPPNPSELLLDTKLNELFDYLKQNFDVIIIDTAPVGMVSDAMSLSRFADATLYIVRQGYTHKKQMGLIDEFHKQGKLPKISIVLNDVKAQGGGYGYGGNGKYGYAYGSGYFEDEGPPPGKFSKWFGGLNLKKSQKKKTKEKV
ncbi:MAG: polysaccharide biosynthesis tyrosine autokinase [Bacteroidota bacterium]|nr:polysaccharide biosynthesis tyrosine autokinase [Bacteroidota bacterium]